MIPMPLKRLQTISFFIMLFVVLVLVFYVLRPFLNILAFGVILAILFYPVYRRLLAQLQRPNLAALLTLLLVLAIVAIPVAFFGQIIINEAINLYGRVSSGDLIISKDQLVSGLPDSTRGLVAAISVGINDLLSKLATNTLGEVSAIVTNVASFLAAVALLFFSLFFLLRDGEKIKDVLISMSPMAERQENILFRRIVTAVNGVVKGSFLLALIHGSVATIGFWIFGVHEPVIWGLLVLLMAFIPNIGTMLSTGAAVAYLAITGHGSGAIGLAIWSLVTILTIDNLLAPRIVAKRVQLHPLLVLLSIFGGIQFFGFLGFMLGPILMAILVAMIDMYRTDFKDTMEA